MDATGGEEEEINQLKKKKANRILAVRDFAFAPYFHLCVSLHITQAHTHTHAPHARTHTHTHTHTHGHTYMHATTHTHRHTQTHSHTQIHTDTQIHTHACNYTLTHPSLHSHRSSTWELSKPFIAFGFH